MQQNTWIIYAGITVAYIVILVLYFVRRTRSHEKELSNFLSTAKQQLESHKLAASQEANLKVAKATQVIKKVQQVAQAFETQAQEEYNEIIKSAKDERREILKQTKEEIATLFETAEQELGEYRQKREQDIERNMVKLVMAITEKVVGKILTPEDHQQLITDALTEIKNQKSRT